jgi:hypothetical protein
MKIDLDAIKWQLSHLGVWPDRAVTEVAEPGEHFLWFELHTDEESFKSNEIRIDIVAQRGRPTRR